VLRLSARRAAVQLPMLAAVLAVVVVGATLLGVCALLLTTSQDRALNEAVARAEPADVAVTAYLTGIQGPDAAPVTAETRAALTSILAPFTATNSARASSVMRALSTADGEPPSRVTYLSGLDGLSAKARLTAGRWPRPANGRGGEPLEAVVLERTAQLLGLAPGDEVRLGREARPDDAEPLTVRVVGVFRPLAGTGWDRDPLAAAGHDPAFNDGRFPQGVPAYGPFVVDLAGLLASGATLNRLEVTAQPDLSAPTGAALDAVGGSLAAADGRLAARLRDRVTNERVVSGLPAALAAGRAQQAVTRSAVLVVALLGGILTAAALALAGRLVAGVRARETALLSALGASPRQFAGTAAAEATLLSVLGAVLAVPLSLLAHAGLVRLPPLAAAGLATPPAVTGAQVAVVVAGATALAALLVVPALRPGQAPAGDAGRRPGLLARSGADVALAALAGAGWWQLAAQPATTGTRTDAVRVLAPAIFLLAGAALALRLVTAPLGVADRIAQRSPGLVLPLAAFEAARRPRAVAAALLLVLAAAAGTFAVAFGATWERSQHDQADLRVGTDLAVALAEPATPGQGTSVAAATGGVVAPVTSRGVAVGEWLGGAGTPPRLVAVDTRRSDALLRGRAPSGRTWAEVGAQLAPRDVVAGVPLRPGGGPAPTLTGRSPDGTQLRVVPRLVLQDATGLRTVCDAAPVALDGRPHALRLCGPAAPGGERRLVAFSLGVAAGAGPGAPGVVPDGSRMIVDLAVPAVPAAGGSTAAPGTWSATSVGGAPAQLMGVSAEVTSAAAATVVRTTATVRLTGYAPAEVVVTAFPRPEAVPVAVSRGLADVIRAPAGTRLGVTVGTTTVPVVVVAEVPSVPSAPGAAAMLADADLLSRALISAGDPAPAVDAWWVGRPAGPGAAARVAGLRLGEVTTRAELSERLVEGPLRVGLPAALAVLVPAAVLLALAGTVLHVTSDLEARALEVARLRGLGWSRRDVLGALLAQHGAVLALLLLAGAAVGAVAAVAIGPPLVRSDAGGAPVPGPVASWPWAAETGLLALLLAGSVAAVALVVAVQVRRADAAHLRVGS
jgi:hypothetical protein